MGIESLGFGLILLAGGLTVAVFIGLTSWLANQQGLFPSWLTILGYVAAVLAVFSAAFFPFLAVLVWTLVAGIYLLVVPQGAATAAT